MIQGVIEAVCQELEAMYWILDSEGIESVWEEKASSRTTPMTFFRNPRYKRTKHCGRSGFDRSIRP